MNSASRMDFSTKSANAAPTGPVDGAPQTGSLRVPADVAALSTCFPYDLTPVSMSPIASPTSEVTNSTPDGVMSHLDMPKSPQSAPRRLLAAPDRHRSTDVVHSGLGLGNRRLRSAIIHLQLRTQQADDPLQILLHLPDAPTS